MNRRQKLVQQQFLNNEKAVIERLKYIYDKSLNEINEKIRNLEFSIGDLTEAYDWAEDAEKAVIKSKIQSKIYQKQYQQALQDQLDGILKEMKTKEFLTVSDYLDLCYEDGFVGSLFDLHCQGVPLTMPLNQESMVRAIQLESKISKGLYTRLGEDVGVLKKRITAEVTRSIATGASWKQMAKRLEDQTAIGYNRSVRIARTEGHRIQCTAADDAAHNAKDRGADVVKQWDATLDGATRESHVAVDGQIRELDQPFSNGLMFPGDPSGAAAEVINCRCAYLQRARWALDGSFTKWNNFTGQLETFDSPEAYDEFKKGFFSPENKKYMNYVQQMEDKYGKDFPKMLDQMSDREYKHYSKLLANNPLYNKGEPVDDLHPLQLAGVKRGKEMTHAEANEGRVNPNYSFNGHNGYRINCQSCVVNYEARRRGYNVETLPNHNNPVAKSLSYNTNLAWIDPATGNHPPIVRSGTKTAKQLLKYMQDNIEEGGRYTFQFYWRNYNSGHIIHAYKEGGQVILYDPQVPVRWAYTRTDAELLDYFKRIKFQEYGRDISPNLLRVDTLMFDEDMAKGIMKAVN
jgi:hypothetical protein